jgi:enoyl-CoA hydratase/carnithine racemase
MTSEDVLLITTADKVRLLTLNRPQRRNALSRELLAALRSAVIAADVDAEVAVVAITGAGIGLLRRRRPQGRPRHR